LLGDEGGTGGALDGSAKGDRLVLVFLVCCHCDVGDGRGGAVLFHTGNDGDGEGDGDGDGNGVF
jgi:hypothetical protein